jgi:hypothetical protein
MKYYVVKSILLILMTNLISLNSFALRCENLDTIPFESTTSVNIQNKNPTQFHSPKELRMHMVSLLTQREKSGNYSKLFRSNAPVYWKWTKARAQSLADKQKKIMSFVGIIMGDSHTANIHPTPQIEETKVVMKDRNIDLDDTHIGSFGFDFLHMVGSLKVISEAVKIPAMIEAYRNGLKGMKMELPKALEGIIDISSEDYEAKRIKYVQKKTQGDKIIKDNKAIVSYDSQNTNINVEHIEKALKDNFGENIELLDLAQIPIEDGGSSGKVKIWTLVKIDGKNHIIEIKEYADGEQELPETLADQNSDADIKNSEVRLEILSKNFLAAREHYGYAPNELPLVRFGSKLVYIREKKITLFDVPYKVKDKKDEELLKALAAWACYNLGKWHAGQPQSNDYIAAIEDDVAGFTELIKEFRHEYQSIIEKGLDSPS